MARSAQSDQVIDDDDVESCPLCIEELDLQDRNFFPCPCGYQVCQFCYNNIKTTMNGLCPACRRQYDEKNVVFKKPTDEQLASHKDAVAQQAKKKAAARQKEAAKREADSLSRKHLAGIRVRQKNLVYITGMRPSTTAENLSEVLRHDEYFGQYGKIIKVVVSKAKENAAANAPVGVYVTFETKEAAARCIQAVDGSQNYDTRLRAQYGTTKYCSAYLRGENCTNRGCMFLHEPGDENESFSRQDLSSMNVISTQSPSQANMPTSGQPPQPQPPPQQAPQSIAAASHVSERQESKDELGSQPGTPLDGPALPSSASWGNRRAPSRQASQHQSTSISSPLAAPPTPAAPSVVSASETQNSATEGTVGLENPTSANESSQSKPARASRPPSLLSLYRQAVSSEDFRFEFDEAAIDPQEKELLLALPPWFDPVGGARRRAGRKEAREQSLRENDNQVASQALAAISANDPDEGAVAGSLQLGGEPEDQSLDTRQRQGAIQPPAIDSVTSPIFGMEQTLSPSAATSNANLSSQQRNALLQQFKSSSPNPQAHLGQASNHGRQASRYSFANDATASASVHPVANPKLMNQQKNMMPPSHYQQQSSAQYFPSGVQGPPPGLKTTGTPPVSGGGMFGQGHGFATAGLSYGMSAGARNSNDEMLRELMRNRGGSAGSGQASDAGRREYLFPLSQSSTPTSHPGLSGFPYGPQSGAFQDHGPPKQKKKGKKHRHANTSSSGGGVVDLADPSILQARMHQASTATNSGLYGAQGQGQGIDDKRFASPLRTLTTTGILETGGDRRSDPSSPFSRQSRKSTPVVPPGLGLPFARPDLVPDAAANLPLMPELGRLPPTDYSTQERDDNDAKKPDHIKVQPMHPPRSPTLLTDGAAFPALPTAKSVNTGTDKEGADPRPARQAAPKSTKKEDKPAVESRTKEAQRQISGHSTDSNVSRPSPQQVTRSTVNLDRPEVQTEGSAETQTVKKSPNASSSRRQHPGKLDISAAQNVDELKDGSNQTDHTAAATDSPIRSAAGFSSTTPSGSSRSGTPALSTEAPVRRATQPRTLRVLATPTPKTESPAPTSAVSTSVPSLPQATKTSTRPSRQASIASANVPETPASDKALPDTASVTTESLSRASSPPPSSKVGTAPVRTKTKSQQKKERKERANTDKTDPEPEPTLPPEIVQEPIVGRKTKAKKPKPVLPSKQQPQDAQPAQKQVSVADDSPKLRQSAPTVPATGERPQIKTEVDQKAINEEKRHSPRTNAFLEELQASGEVSAVTLSSLFKTTPSLLPKLSAAADLESLEPLTPLSTQEVNQLKSGKAVRRGTNQSTSRKDKDINIANRLLITPYTRSCLRGLPKNLEERFLALEARIMKTNPPKKYSHRASDVRAAAAAKEVDELLKDMTAALLPASDPDDQRRMPSNSQDDPSIYTDRNQAPVQSQVYGDDALEFLNQFILPYSASNRTPSSALPSSVGRQYAPESALRPPADPIHPSAAQASPLDDENPTQGGSVPHAYTTGGSPYPGSALDAAGNSQSPSTEAQSAPASASHSSLTRFAPHLDQRSMANELSQAAAGYPTNIDAFASQAARDAIAATLGAASSKLANVASEAAAAIPESSKNANKSAPWQTSGVLETLNADLGEEIKNLPEMINLSADAIRNAIMSSGLGATSSGQSGPSKSAIAQNAGSRNSEGQPRRNASNSGDSAMREPNMDEAARIMMELETALVTGRKELENIEKKLGGLVKRNRKAVGV